METRDASRNDTLRSDMTHEVDAYTNAHRQKRRWHTVLSVLAAIVVFVTAYALVVPAATMTMDTATLPEGAQVPEGYTQIQTARDENNGFAVTVYAPEGAVPEGATLKADLIAEGTDAYAEAEQAVIASQPEAQSADGEKDYGFAALDIRFEDADGNEVEPAGDVYVSIDAAGLLSDDADPESVTVQHLAEDEAGAVVRVDTVAYAASESEGIAAAAVTEDVNTVQAAFAVDGFSTFAITWGTWPQRTLTVHYVDQSGNEIQGNTTSNSQANDNEWVSLSEFAASVLTIDQNTYEYQGAHVSSYNGTGARWVRHRSSGNQQGWYYSNSNSRPSTNGNRFSRESSADVYLVYSKQIGTVDTVDSTAEGVHMYMFNYRDDKRQFDEGGYTEDDRTGDVKEGLVSSTTNNNGWPVFSGRYETTRNESLAQFFGSSRSAYEVSDASAANHLFLQSRYDEDGTFYYSAFENFAKLENNGNFTLYNALGTPSNGSQYYFKRGNFMPYNDLNFNSVANRNLYNSEGEALQPGETGYNDPIYALEGTADFHFGMYVWADFYQPQGGQVENNAGTSSKDMVFEFTGDDDMWVFIDGVLVLDLGGIHDAQSGSINFATGKVRYTDTVLNSTQAEWHETTLRAQYEAANRGGSVDWKGDTFADGSSHRIQIFYMERGEGASNLKISFNLKTIPDGQLSVAKDVENYYAPQVAGIEYTMQVTVNGKPYANAEYTIIGNEETVLQTDSNGQFKLRHDQTATFPDLQVGEEVTVKEVGSTDTEEGVTIDKNYEITYTVTDGAGNTTGDTGEDGTITAEMPGYGSIRVTVNNKATYTRPIRVVKSFDGTEDNKAPNGFEATYTLFEVDEDGNKIEPAIGSVKYSDFKNGEYTFWLDTNKNYTVVESFGDGDNKAETETLLWQRVDTTTNDPAEGTQASAGIVHLDEHDATFENTTTTNPVDTITLTNVYGKPTADLTIIKNIYGFTGDQVEKLIETDPMLRFDVDVFEDGETLIEDENSNNPNEHLNYHDWTFDVKDTLDSDGFMYGSWDSEVTGYENGGPNQSIDTDESANYTSISMEKVTDGTGTYYRYEVTIKDVALNDWYRVWEQHMEVAGYDVNATVAEYPSDGTDNALDNYLVDGGGNSGDHGGRATAFQLTEDTTVEFTNTYTPNVFTGTKVNEDGSATLSGAEFYLKNSDGKFYFVQDVDGLQVTTWVDGVNQATKLTSGSDGTFSIQGLADGTYTLIESRAPDGYILPTTDFTFTVKEGEIALTSLNNPSLHTADAFKVTNTTGIELPNTGGSGTTLITYGGIALMAVAACGYGLRRRSERGGAKV